MSVCIPIFCLICMSHHISRLTFRIFFRSIFFWRIHDVIHLLFPEIANRLNHTRCVWFFSNLNFILFLFIFPKNQQHQLCHTHSYTHRHHNGFCWIIISFHNFIRFIYESICHTLSIASFSFLIYLFILANSLHFISLCIHTLFAFVFIE